MDSKFKKLLERYEKGQLSDKEKQLVDEWLDHLASDAGNSLWTSEDEDVLKNKILNQITFAEQPVEPVSPFRYWKVAASIALVAVIGYGAYRYMQADLPAEALAEAGADIKPGGDKAILTLADGTQVELNTIQTSIPQQGIAKVINQDGKLSYVSAQSPQSDESVINTVSTPRGGQYQLTLSDGSKVWLNAASSLKYPAAFSGNERIVELTGEAYFEIAHNKEMPFKVRLETGAEVEVLGTHFNVMAYSEEQVIKTTLLEGSVKVSSPGGGGPANAGEGARLEPNQQAQISQSGTLSILKDYDTSEAIAWKNNKFMFRDTPLREIMNQLSRWYDVDVVFEDNIGAHRFGAVISRKENAGAVLEILEMTGEVDFEIQGRKIIIRKGS